MKEFSLVLTFILISTQVFTQKVLSEQDIKLYNNGIKSYILSHEKGKTISLVQEDDNNIHLQHLDEAFNVSKQLFFPKEKFGSTRMLTCSVEDNHYLLYFQNSITKNIITNKKKVSFSMKSINYESGDWESHDLPFTLNDETLISSFSQNNHAYFLTLHNKFPLLNLYILNGIEIVESKEFDLSDYKEFGKKNSSNLLQIAQGLDNANEFVLSIVSEKIKSGIPTIHPSDAHLHLKSYHKFKLYYSADKIYITEDLNRSETTVVSLNLNDFTHTINAYKHGNTFCEGKSYPSNSSDSNSFIMDDKLYLVSACKEEIIFSVMNLINGEKIQSYTTSKNKIAYVDNSSDSRTSFFALSKETTIPSPKKALSKLAKGNIFITAYQKGEEIKITIGRYKAEQKGSVSYVGTNGSVIPVVGADYRPSTLNFCFNPVLDNSQFELIKDKSKNNKALDDIRHLFKIHQEEMEANILAPSILASENGYILGYYYVQKQKYYLRKFSH